MKTQQSDMSDSGFVLDADIDRDLFCSSGGVSDSGASLAALADMGGLSPVLEENAEVVTKNPMRAAIANGAHFHSVGESAKFHSNGGSSKYQSFGGDSSKFQSSLGGDSSRREEADEDVEEGGMFADADVVAVLAAAAAAAQKEDNVVVKKSGMAASGRGWYQGSGGSWIKSPSWNGESATEAVTVEQVEQVEMASTPSRALALEEKAPEAANDIAQGPHAPAVDWMVSTRKGFERDSSTGADWLDALKNACDTVVLQEEKNGRVAQSPEIVAAAAAAAAHVSTAAIAGEKKEDLGDGRPTTAAVAATGVEKATAATTPSKGQALVPSPQMVDGISARAFGQAEMVAVELPSVTTERGAVVEPECEVPKPGACGAPIARKKKLGEYSWLSSSGRNLKETGRKTEAEEAEKARVKPPLLVGSAAPVAPAHRPHKNPAANGGLANIVDPAADGSASIASRKAPSVLPTESGADSFTSTTLPGSTPGRGQTPAPEPEQHEAAGLNLPPKAQGGTARCPPLTPVGGPTAVLNPIGCSSPSPKKPSWLPALSTPDRNSRVGQVVEALERLTPRVRSAAVTPGTKTPGSFTPGASTPGAAGWTTPVATPDRTPQTVKVPPEEQKVGKEWTVLGITPDRTPKASAPDSAGGGATPECTATPDDAFVGGKMGVSPADERQFAWKLESPAGVDGLPSPSEADIQAAAANHKKGRVIASILGAADTVVTEGESVLASGADGTKPRQFRRGMVSGEKSPPGAWELAPSFGASQMSAFAAGAKAEVEARTAAVEAQAGAAQEVGEEGGVGKEEEKKREIEEVEGEEKREIEEEEEEKRELDPEARVVKADDAQLAEAEAPPTLPAMLPAAAMSPAESEAVRETEEAAAAVEAVEAAAKAHATAHAEGFIDGDADTDADSFVDALAETPARPSPVPMHTFVKSFLGGGEGEEEDDEEDNFGLPVGAAGGTPFGVRVGAKSAVAGGPKWMEGGGDRPEQREEREMAASGEEKKEDEGEQDSFHEAAEVAALVAEAMAMAEEDEQHATVLYPADDGEDDGAAVIAKQVDDSSDDRSERGGRAALDGPSFASSKSILTWKEGENVEDGDAERDAEEVAALVAEALALVKEASENAGAGSAPGY